MYAYAVDQIHEYTREAFHEAGITYSNYATLRMLYENPGITQKELCVINRKDKNVIVGLIEVLTQLYVF